ncbi:MAG: hypothetical protein BGO98_05305 [Myxococcales bacterium 68-20]|nr:IgGFc-binding protein [Myxococcales bacterium]OJY28495.1 MAG: hypothetical protein BGO98_05305 [Myxococcales bacterium 68-20]
MPISIELASRPGLVRATVFAAALAMVLGACSTLERPAFQDPREVENEDGGTAPPPLSEVSCGCSADGRSVVRCDGSILTECGVAGCHDGSCAPDLCEAAKAKQSSEGCAFYTTVPDAYLGAQGCFAVFLNNTTPHPAEVRLRYGALELDGRKFVYVPEGSGSAVRYTELPDGRIPPSTLAIAFLAGPHGFVPGTGPSAQEYRPCPAEPAVKATSSQPRDTGPGLAFVITTTQPVGASDIYPYGGADSYVTGASTLLPINAWGTKYLTAVAGGAAPITERSWLDLVAEVDTAVTMRPLARRLPGAGTVPPLAIGQAHTIQLRAGEVHHLVQPVDLSAVALTSEQPFMAIAGTRCWGAPCDASHQQLVPVPALGSEYVAVGHRDRVPAANETHAFRVIGAVDGTTLTYLPAPPEGAPATLDLGSDVIIESRTPFVVRSQDSAHPFYVAEYMTGCLTVDPSAEHGCPGDPEFTSLVPPEQLAQSYVFFSDPTYPTTHLVVVRVRAASGAFEDVELDCAGALDGWSPLGDRYEYTRLDLVTGGVDQGACRNGRHEIASKAPFGVTVWGWGSGVGKGGTGCTSYALPAAVGLRPINQADVH